MAQAGVLTRPRRGSTRVTDRGRKVLAEHPDRVDMKALKEFPEYVEFRARRRDPAAGHAATEEVSSAEVEPAAETPPQEAIPRLVAEAHDVLAAELLERLRAGPPEFLERAVLQLLVKMGYGGPESIHHLGGPGDQGLDGLVRQDPLGLDVVYVQAKRYQSERVVQRPDVQAFVGALQGAQADRGIFITTSRFSDGAARYAESVAIRVVLIDGVELGRLMVRYGCGVQVGDTIELKELDEDFFDLP